MDAIQPDDGYVKYSAHRRESPLPELPWFQELNETRTALHRLGLIGIYENGIGFGNISRRYEGESFVISGTATGADETLTKDQYALVESFNLNNNSVQVSGLIDASSESMSHGAVYRASPETQAVIHIHSRQLFDIMMDGAYPRTPSQVAYGTPEMAWAVESVVKAGAASSGLFVLAGHDEGIIAYGESLEKALELILTLNQQI